MVAEEMGTDDILAEFPQLTLAEIQDSLRYAAAAVHVREIPPRSSLCLRPRALSDDSQAVF